MNTIDGELSRKEAKRVQSVASQLYLVDCNCLLDFHIK